MTNDLKDKINSLCSENKYQEAITLIESLPEEEQTYNLKLKLASLYYDISEEDDTEQLTKALKVLQSISNQGETDISWLYLTAKIYFHLNMEEIALEYFERLDRIFQKDNEIHSDLFVKHFITSCKEYIQNKTIHVIQNVFNNICDGDVHIGDTNGNVIFLHIPECNINIKVTMLELHKNECKLEFDTTSPIEVKEIVQGYGHSLENAVYIAVSNFISTMNKKLNEKMM